MAKELVFTVYEYDELAEKAKQKALEKLFDINVEFDDWYNLVYEEQTEKLQKMGFADIDIAFTGFWSQGDGASFTCKGFDIVKWLKHTKTTNKYRTIFNWIERDSYYSGWVDRHNSHYYHERSTKFHLEAQCSSFDYETKRRFEQQISDLEEFINQEIVSLNKAIYRTLEKEYEAYTSKECVEDTIRANEYLFHNDGVILSRSWLAKELV